MSRGSTSSASWAGAARAGSGELAGVSMHPVTQRATACAVATRANPSHPLRKRRCGICPGSLNRSVPQSHDACGRAPREAPVEPAPGSGKHAKWQTEPAPNDSGHHAVKAGTTEALIASTDWSSSPVGPSQGWPGSLRTVLRLMLGSRYAMWMGWGRDLTFFCNDTYANQTLGAKYPWALGRTAREVWAEIWDDIGPLNRARAPDGAGNVVRGTAPAARAKRLSRGDVPHVLVQPGARRCARRDRRPVLRRHRGDRACHQRAGASPSSAASRLSSARRRRREGYSARSRIA